MECMTYRQHEEETHPWLKCAVALSACRWEGASHRQPGLQDAVHQLVCDCILVAVALLEHALDALQTHHIMFRWPPFKHTTRRPLL